MYTYKGTGCHLILYNSSNRTNLNQKYHALPTLQCCSSCVRYDNSCMHTVVIFTWKFYKNSRCTHYFQLNFTMCLSRQLSCSWYLSCVCMESCLTTSPQLSHSPRRKQSKLPMGKPLTVGGCCLQRQQRVWTPLLT